MLRRYSRTASSALVADTVVVVDESADTTCFVAFFNSAAGDLAAKTGTNLTFNSNTGALTATSFVGPATQVTVADESTDTTCFPLFVTAATGGLPPKSGTNLTFQSATGVLGATIFDGPIGTGTATPAEGAFAALGSSGACTLDSGGTGSSFGGALGVTGLLTASAGLTVAAGSFMVTDAGPHAVGGAAVDWAQWIQRGSFTSGGASNKAVGLYFNSTITGDVGDTGWMASVGVLATLVTGAGAAVDDVSAAKFYAPTITDNTTGAGITNTQTVLITGAPTVGNNKWALRVASGATYFGGTSTLTGNVGIGAASSANADLKLEAGRLMLKESATPTADSGYGKVYTKTDDKPYFQDGAGVEHEILTTGNVVTYKSYGIADVGNSGRHFVAGFYAAPAAHVILTIGGSVTQTYGAVGEMKAAHAFAVASGAGGTDLVLTVTGISIAEDGTRNDSDSEVIVADTDTATTDAYYETTKKWLGQITYTLTGTAGAFTFNYGFAKYDDFGNRDFTVTDFEMHLHGGASETGFDIQLCYHSPTGWTYSAGAFLPGAAVICSSLTDNSSTNDNFANGDEVAYKRSGLTTAISGSTVEGVVVQIITAVNNSIQFGTVHVGVTV